MTTSIEVSDQSKQAQMSIARRQNPMSDANDIGGSNDDGIKLPSVFANDTDLVPMSIGKQT